MRFIERTDGNNIVKLDKKDEKILSALAENVRTPISVIARSAGISKQSAQYRVQMLEERGVLAGSRTVIDTKRFGVFSYHVFVEVHKEAHEKELRERCMKREEVNSLIQYLGRWNYEISILAKDPREFHDLFSEIITNLEVQSHAFAIIVSTIKAQVLPNVKSERSVQKIAYTADEKDVAILNVLARNAAKPLIAIAKDARMDAETVKKRMQRLRDAGYIIQFRPIIDYSRLGKSVECLLVAGNLPKEFSGWISESKDVLWCAQTVGNWDYIIYIMSERLDEVHEFAGELKKRFGDKISATEVLLSSQNLKYSFWTSAIGKQFKQNEKKEWNA